MLFCAPTVKNGHCTRWCSCGSCMYTNGTGIRGAEHPNNSYICMCLWCVMRFLRPLPSMCGSPCPSIYYVGSVISVLPDNITTTGLQHNTSPSRRTGALSVSAFGGSARSVRISKYYIHFHDMHHMSTCLVLIV